MLFLIRFSLLLPIFFTFFQTSTLSINPETGVCQEVVIPHGYNCEEHVVTTKDGYILGLQRIPNGRTQVSGAATGKRPVLLQHGLMGDGISWMLNSPEQSLPFILADRGFDVWIANTRGTQWSRRHSTLPPDSREYWNWSFDELAAYDFPAITNFVHERTGQKLHYVGHSLGTLVPLVSFSERKLVEKFRSVAFLSPAAYLNHMTSPLGVAVTKSLLPEISKWIGIAEFNLNMPAIEDFLKDICSRYGINCFDFFTAFTGPNCCLNASTYATFSKYEPHSTSTKTIIHLAQDARTGVLAKYDYVNPFVNLLRYWSFWPPIYNLANIPSDLPIFISYGGVDALSDVADVARLLDHLRSHDADKIRVQYVSNYAHFDFIMAFNAKEVIYDPLLTFFDAYL